MSPSRRLSWSCTPATTIAITTRTDSGWIQLRGCGAHSREAAGGSPILTVHARSQHRAVIRDHIARRLQLRNQHADRQQDFLACASLRRRRDGALPILPHLFREKRRERLKLRDGRTEKQTG